VVERLAKCGVKLIALRCAGFDRVDLNACQQHGIKVSQAVTYKVSMAFYASSQKPVAVLALLQHISSSPSLKCKVVDMLCLWRMMYPMRGVCVIPHNNVNFLMPLCLQVARVPTYSPTSVAEHAVSLLMALNRCGCCTVCSGCCCSGCVAHFKPLLHHEQH
jgi:hypothetical protein